MSIYDQSKQRNKAKGFFGMAENDERQKLIDEADQHIKGIAKNGKKLHVSHRIGTLNKIARLAPDVRDDILGAAQISTTRLTNTLHNLSDSLEGKPRSLQTSPADAIFDTDPASLQAAIDRSHTLVIKGKPKLELAGRNNLAANWHAPVQSDADPVEAIGLGGRDVRKEIPDKSMTQDERKPVTRDEIRQRSFSLDNGADPNAVTDPDYNKKLLQKRLASEDNPVSYGVQGLGHGTLFQMQREADPYIVAAEALDLVGTGHDVDQAAQRLAKGPDYLSDDPIYRAAYKAGQSTVSTGVGVGKLITIQAISKIPTVGVLVGESTERADKFAQGMGKTITALRSQSNQSGQRTPRAVEKATGVVGGTLAAFGVSGDTPIITGGDHHVTAQDILLSTDYLKAVQHRYNRTRPADETRKDAKALTLERTNDAFIIFTGVSACRADGISCDPETAYKVGTEKQGNLKGIFKKSISDALSSVLQNIAKPKRRP